MYLQRLEDKGANYNRQEWERDRINKLIYLANISQWPETYVEALKKMGIDPFHRNRPASASSTAAAATNPPATKLSASSLAREKTPSSTALRSQSLARPRSARPPLKTSKPVRIRPKTAIGSSGSRSYQSTATASWTSSGSLSNANQSNAKDFIFNQPRTPDERARSRRPQTAGPSRSRSANPKLAIAEKPLRPQSASAAGRAYAKNLVVTSTSAPQTPLSVTRPASAHARPTTATAASRGIASKPPAVAPTTTTTLQHNSSLFSQFTDDDSLFNDKGKLTDKHHHHQNNPLSSSQSSINNRVRFEEAETPSTHPSLSRNSSFNTANTPAAPTPATHSYTKKPHSLTKTATEDDIDNFYKDDFFNDVTPAKKEAVVASVAPGESVDKDDMGSPSKNVVQMLETFMTISNNHENAENKQQELNTIASNIVKRVVSESENLADVVLDPHEAKMLVDLIVENEKTTPASSSSVNAAQFEPSLRELITDVVNRKVAQGATVTNKMGSKENLKNSISNLEASLDKQSVPKLPEKENSSSFFSGVRRSIRSLRSTNSSRTGSTTNISSK